MPQYAIFRNLRFRKRARKAASLRRETGFSVNDEFFIATTEPWRPDPRMFSRHLAWRYREHHRTILDPMRVLAHIHTLNDADVIEQALGGLLRQTRQPDGIV